MNNKKICSFFVSEYHLLTVLLPYINEKILEEKNIELVLQNDMNIKVKEYLSKVKSLNLENEEILKLKWKKTKIEKVTLKSKEIIIVVGNQKYIEDAKKIIDITSNIEEIVDCYSISNDMEEINKIVARYEEILNTDGKHNLEKNSQNTQKRKTIQTQM